MVRAMVLAAGLALAASGHEYEAPMVHGDAGPALERLFPTPPHLVGKPVLDAQGKPMMERRCCRGGLLGGLPLTSQRGAGFWAGRGRTAPPR